MRGRALVIGGSMSGLLAGLMLRERGWDVEVFERVESPLSGRGAGIVAQGELIAILKSLRLDTRELGVELTTRQLLDVSGGVAARLDCPQVLTAWERVFRVLRDGFPSAHYHRGVGLKSFEQSAVAAVAHLTDGRSIEGDLLIGADGLRSTVRQACLPEVAPRYAGYVAWRSLLAEEAIPPDLFAYMTFCLPPGEQFLGYPVAGPDNDLRPGHRRYNVVWYRPADEHGELQRLLTDESGVTHAISIPPPLIRRAAIADMRAAAERLVAPQLAEIVRLMAEPILQPIYDLESPRMAFGRVAIIGDAAFVARPHVAAGVSKAAEDAQALAEALVGADDVAEVLRSFQARRLPVNTRIIERARHLGAYLQATQTAEERARSERHGIPAAVMAETAVLDFLYT
jgi:2-polyprenyl-6-methoxyphenol hydroxylase-like FAD-dependent oxidoreductase